MSYLDTNKKVYRVIEDHDSVLECLYNELEGIFKSISVLNEPWVSILLENMNKEELEYQEEQKNIIIDGNDIRFSGGK